MQGLPPNQYTFDSIFTILFHSHSILKICVAKNQPYGNRSEYRDYWGERGSCAEALYFTMHSCGFELAA